MSNQKALYFPQLDVLRLIAAFSIVLVHGWHAIMSWWYPTSYPSAFWDVEAADRTFLGHMVHRFVHNLPLGVDLFFLVSGFLITYILLKERSTYGKINIVNFFVRRGLRIWPLYFLLIAVTPFLIGWLDEGTPSYLPNLLFYNNFSQIAGDGTYPFQHYWSISVEEHFYLFWPFILAFLSPKFYKHAFVLVIGLSIGFRAYIGLTTEDVFMPLYMNTLSRIDIMAIGGLIALRHFQKPIQLNVQLWLRLLVYATLIVLLCFDDVFKWYWDSTLVMMFKKYVYVAGLGFWVFNYCFNPKAFLQFRKLNLIHYLGKASYGMYMYHNFLIPIIIKKIMWPYELMDWHGPLVFALLYFGMAITIPIISFEIIEKPFLKAKSRFAKIATRL